MAVTRLGLYGGPRGPYGTFSGKTEAVVVSAALSKGWLPPILVDKDGNPVSEVIEQVVEAVEAAPKSRKEAAEAAADRTVKYILEGAQRASAEYQRDVARLQRELRRVNEQAAESLRRDIQRARRIQQDDDDAIALLLLA